MIGPYTHLTYVTPDLEALRITTARSARVIFRASLVAARTVKSIYRFACLSGSREKGVGECEALILLEKRIE